MTKGNKMSLFLRSNIVVLVSDNGEPKIIKNRYGRCDGIDRGKTVLGKLHYFDRVEDMPPEMKMSIAIEKLRR